MSADLAIGSELAGYRIDALVGRGGMGVVYRAEQLRLGRAVALKVLAPGLASDEEFRARFERESRLAALIDHPNVVPIYEAGEARGLLFIAMRWVAGRDLGVLLKKDGPLDPERTVEILAQVASALDAAHGRGLVHRDVKPGNILIADAGDSASAGHVYLTDFGIAKMTSSVGVTRTGVFLGTPDYAAPEQFEGRDLDGRVDVYALGCLFFQCLTGSRPFERTTEVAVMYAHLNDPPPRVSEVRSDVGPALDAVLAKGMAKDRNDRYPTCSELIDAARAALTPSEDVTLAAPPLAAATVANPPPTVADSPRPPAPPPPPAAPPPPVPPKIEPTGGRPRRRWAWLVAAAAVAAVAVAGVLVFTLRGGDDTAAGTATAAETATTTGGETGGETTTGQTAAADPAWTGVESDAFSAAVSQESQRVAMIEDGTAIAVGTEGLGGEHDAVFWTVTVGGSSGVAKQALGQAGEEVVFGIASLGAGGAVAVGFQQAEPPQGDTAAAVWLRTDQPFAGDFEAVDIGPAASAYEKMNRVTVSKGTIVAVGAAGPGRDDSGTPLATDAAVWVSSDGGASWEREDVDGLRADNYQEMRGVVGDGTEFVAVGYDGKDAAVWRSDGGSWILTGTPGQLWATDSRPELDMRDVVNASRLVAVGDVVTAAGDRDGAVWLSEDAEAWERVEPDAMGGPGDQQVFGLVEANDVLVAVGCSDCEGDLVVPAVWTSADGGDTWTRVDEGRVPAFDGSQQMNSIAVVGDELVASGWNQTGEKRDAAVWTADLTSSGG